MNTDTLSMFARGKAELERRAKPRLDGEIWDELTRLNFRVVNLVTRLKAKTLEHEAVVEENRRLRAKLTSVDRQFPLRPAGPTSHGEGAAIPESAGRIDSTPFSAGLRKED